MSVPSVSLCLSFADDIPNDFHICFFGATCWLFKCYSLTRRSHWSKDDVLIFPFFFSFAFSILKYFGVHKIWISLIFKKNLFIYFLSHYLIRFLTVFKMTQQKCISFNFGHKCNLMLILFCIWLLNKDHKYFSVFYMMWKFGYGLFLL